MSATAVVGVVLVAGGLLAGTAALLWPRDPGAVPDRVPLKAVSGIAGPAKQDEVLDRVSRFAERLVDGNGRVERLKGRLDAAGIAMAPGEWILVQGATITAAVLLGALAFGVVGALLLAVLAGVMFTVVRSVKASRRQANFAEQLGDTLMLLSSSLRAGYGLLQALDGVAREADPPTSEEFGRIVIETRLGRSVPDAMGAAAERVHNEDFEWVVEAITINRDVGGELSEVLSRVAETIRQRDRLRRQVKALSAEGRISALFLTALPIILFTYMKITNPSYVGLLTSSVVGWVMLGVGVTLLVVGSLWMRALVRVRY